jgi:hypothetical protein
MATGGAKRQSRASMLITDAEVHGDAHPSSARIHGPPTCIAIHQQQRKEARIEGRRLLRILLYRRRHSLSFCRRRKRHTDTLQGASGLQTVGSRRTSTERKGGSRAASATSIPDRVPPSPPKKNR